MKHKSTFFHTGDSRATEKPVVVEFQAKLKLRNAFFVVLVGFSALICLCFTKGQPCQLHVIINFFMVVIIVMIKISW